MGGVGLALLRLFPPHWKPPDPPPWLLFCLATGAFLLIGVHYTSQLRVSGDEPHYLLMAQSLWRERDLDLRDNLERGDFREYTPGPLVPHWGTPRRDGRPFPAHSPGLPFLLAPIYALGGRRACVAFLSLVGGALGLEVRRLALRLMGDRRDAALLAWAAAVGPPAAYYSFHVYTELPSALAVAFCLRVLLSTPATQVSRLADPLTMRETGHFAGKAPCLANERSLVSKAWALPASPTGGGVGDASPGAPTRSVVPPLSSDFGDTTLGALAAALAASALPWLHMKMAPVAAGLGALAIWRLRGRPRLVFLATAGVMATGYLAYYRHVFGTPSPLAVYGGLPPELQATTIARALLGLLVDRSFGLLPHAPVFVLALAGLVMFVGKPTREGGALLALAGLMLAPVLPWRMWWGGQCPPGRFLVPLVPVLAVLLAARASPQGPRGLQRWRWPLVACGWALALLMAARPGALLFLNRGDRPTRLWAALSGEVPVQRYLPSIVSSSGPERRVAALWMGVVVLLLLLDLLAQRRDGPNRLFGGLGLPVSLLLLLGVLVDTWARGPQVEPLAPPGVPLGARPAVTRTGS